MKKSLDLHWFYVVYLVINERDRKKVENNENKA